jgi:hypothetical protein
MRRLILVAAAVSTTLGACATAPQNIAPAYVSPLTYDAYSCSMIAQEAERVSARAAALTGQQQKASNNDKALVAVGIVLFWPALFFVNGNKGTEAELANMKGAMDAIQQAAIKKNCKIQFTPT